ncbi:uncharacterized protein LOC131291177 [Anopheles ziemanni]|uniref:uncharacterized protein LOC131291177 n=1 Tax=Anopheles ziemanni TaxID=345580 RepID=UPI0026600CBB|nr:uncharacterized protein LOC131291177 [Anopheles ziemanni]
MAAHGNRVLAVSLATLERMMSPTPLTLPPHASGSAEDAKKNSTKRTPRNGFSGACWSRCSSTAAEQTLDRSTPEGSGRCQLELTVQRMVRNESLVVADISWAGGNRTKLRLCPSTGGQCLVTWEVSGGGLMGNLLTESTSVQLSLWSDTNYRIQVTCRSKHANSPLVRSAPLTLNTSGAIMLQQRVPLSSTSTNNPVEMDRRDGELPWPNEIAEGDDDEALARELDSSGEAPDTPSGKLHAWMVARDGENTLAILALFVAVLLALLALLTIAALVRWRPGSGDSTDHLDKDVLVENELIVKILHVLR